MINPDPIRPMDDTVDDEPFPDERPVHEQYAEELRRDPFFLPGVDDYDDGWVNEADTEEN